MNKSDLFLTAHIGLITFLVSVIASRLLIRLNISAVPMMRSSHQVPTPSAGGLAFILAFSIGVGLCLFACPFKLHALLTPLKGFSIAAFLLGIVSFRDDCHPVSYRARLFTHILAACAILLGGLSLNFPAFPQFDNGWFAQIMTLITLIGLINGANFLDGLNGLLAGSVILNLIFMVFLAPLTSGVALLMMVLIVAILGFLVFNFPFGKIFMGDVGSTFLGLTLGVFALLLQSHSLYPSNTAWVDKTFILSLMPTAFLWFDVGFTLIRRAFLGRRLTEAHRDHLFHLLHDAGHSHGFVSSIHFLTVIFMGCLTLGCYHGFLSFLELVTVYGIVQAGFCWWVFRRTRWISKYEFENKS